MHLQDREPESEQHELSRELLAEERGLPRLHLKRLHLVNGRPIGATDSWLVGEFAGLLADRNLIEGSVWKTPESASIFSRRGR